MAFATRSGGRILHAQTYPLQEIDAEEGDGRLIRGGRLIRTIRYRIDRHNSKSCTNPLQQQKNVHMPTCSLAGLGHRVIPRKA